MNVNDNFDLMIVPENAKNANGGTELMHRKLYDGSIPRELLEQCQIIPTRITGELDPTKIRIYVVHDLPGDPSCEHLKNGGWNKFHRIMFVSNHQMQNFIKHYNIPWSKCVVLQNAIVPLGQHTKPTDKINLIYFSTPHRGLQLLVPVFEKLAEEFDFIHLDVFSSFNLYGWTDRDAPFQELFDRCKSHDQISYHGAVSNHEIRNALQNSHILAYPSIWEETSCLVLIEAMSAGLCCVHPNYGALSETASNWTNMYQFQEDMSKHANLFYGMLRQSIIDYNEEHVQAILKIQQSYVNTFYNWNNRKNQWIALITGLLGESRDLPADPKDVFHYVVR